MSCGGGVQVRTAHCVDLEGNVLDDSNCYAMTPVTKQNCEQKECPKWSTGDWTTVRTVF